MNLRKYAPVGLVLAVVLALALFNNLDTPDETSAGITTGQPAAESATQPAQFSDLAVITLAELPVEALDTLGLIDSGGPYPFDRDDLTFQNREALLPDRPRGHYREYTVITPGEDDRGARRIVAGADGERYYTADHYDSFREILN